MSANGSSHAWPFDAVAGDYDASFSHRGIGRMLREAVWRHVDTAFATGQTVLDLGCGTGEDAIHLGQRGVRVIALDASAAMVEVARGKVFAAGLEATVEVTHRAIEVWAADALAEAGPGSCVDGAMANFGVLNCVESLDGVLAALAGTVRPGGRIWLAVMGPRVPWEWAWWLARGEPRRAFRRLGRGGADWRGLRIHYPSVSRVVSACAPRFEVTCVAALGALVPPPYADGWAERHPRLVGTLARWERRFEQIPPLPHLADHFLVGATRRLS